MAVTTLCLLLVLIATRVNSECQLVKSLITSSIPDNAFTASSSLNRNRGPERARISAENSWCSKSLDNITVSPWIQVDLGNNYEIHSIGVAGHERNLRLLDDYIVNYYVLYGPVNDSLQFVIDPITGHAKVFPRFKNSFQQTRLLPVPVIGQVVRIMALPGSSNRDRVCIKFEVNGCISNLTTIVPSSTYKPTTKTTITSDTILSSSTVLLIASNGGNSDSNSIVLAAAISAIVTCIITVLVLVIAFGLSIMIWKIFKRKQDMKRITQTTSHPARNSGNHYYEDIAGTISLRRNRELIRHHPAQYDKLERQSSTPTERARSGLVGARSVSESALYDNLKNDSTLQYDYVSTERIVVSRANSTAPLKTSVESIITKSSINGDTQAGTPRSEVLAEQEELLYNPSYGQST